MIEVGTKVRVFKEKENGSYHNIGEWKDGVILKKYPNFYLVLIEDAYKECFYESEIVKYDKNIEPEQKMHI